MQLAPRGLSAADENIPALVTDALSLDVEAISHCQVISQSDIQAMAAFQVMREQCGDDDTNSCMSEIGSALGVQRIITGTIGRLGDDYVLQARLVDINSAVVEQRAEQIVRGGPSQLRPATTTLARVLFKVEAPAPAPAALPAGLVSWSTAGVGVVAALVGGYVVYDADTKLGTAALHDKDSALVEGTVGLVVTGVGVLVAGAGVAVALMGGP
jgi:hypothetical protein